MLKIGTYQKPSVITAASASTSYVCERGVQPEGILLFLSVVSNLYSHDSQWPIRDNSERKEKE